MSPLILINPSAFPSFMTMTFLENTGPCLNRLHRKKFLRNVGFTVVIIVLQLTIFVSKGWGGGREMRTAWHLIQPCPEVRYTSIHM